MSASAAASCMVVLNQQREQTIQHHHEQCEQCDKETIAPGKGLLVNCTIVENGKVVVKSVLVKPAPLAADPSSAS